MKSTKKLKLALALVLLILPVIILLQSCGDVTSAPDGSTLTVDPTTMTANLTYDATRNINVTARYKDESPMPNAKIHIYGSFAEPRSPGAYYQFYYYPEGLNTLRPGGNRPVDSGFDAYTDDSGVFSFSIVIYGGSSFDDNIQFNSGTATASLPVSVTTGT